MLTLAWRLKPAKGTDTVMNTKKLPFRLVDSLLLVLSYLLYNRTIQIAVVRVLS